MSPLILGGGPAGSAAAIALALRGVRATILERTREAGDALCGGFLSWRTLGALGRLGIDADDLNPRRITRIRILSGRQSVEAALPAPACGVSRSRLDALLLDRAGALGVGVERGVAVRALTGRTARLADGAEVTSDTVLLATGKHDVRGMPRDAAMADDPTLGLRLHVRARASLVGVIELHLFDGGYAGLAVQEDGRTNLCMAVARSRLSAAGDPMALLASLGRENPALAHHLDGLEATARVDTIANVPYGWRATSTIDGLYRLGDQAAVIPSLAGEGMGIAVASGTAAAQALLSGATASTFQDRFAQAAARPLAVAGMIRHLAERPTGATALIALAHAPWIVRAVASLTRIKQSGVDEAR